MIILGLNAYHGDSSACLVRDGKLIAAAEEERFRRIKHWAGFPSEAIRYCLREAGVGLSEVGCVAINQNSAAHFWRKAAYVLLRRPDPRLVFERLRIKRQRTGVHERLEAAFPGQRFEGRLCPVEHHLAHLCSAHLVSGFEESVCVSVDGFGDFSSAAWGLARGSRVAVEDGVYFPHSLGIFYETITRHLGFPSYGDEYKVMGLAPYGKPTYLTEMRKIVQLKADGRFALDLRFFTHHRSKVHYQWEDGEPLIGSMASDALRDLLGPPRSASEKLAQRHRDLAHSAQRMYEEAFFHLLDNLHDRYGVNALALAGGCAMNSVANGGIYRNTPFKRLYVQSAAGDAGGAIGAAFHVWHQVSGSSGRFLMDHAYFGPGYANSYVAELLQARTNELSDCLMTEILDEGVLCGEVARAIATGQVVGWFQGRMEWGPRALGNRSILGDPRRAGMKDILNTKIKRRESFRPFAPSILRESVSDWFEQDDEVPFMMQVLPIRGEKRHLIPAVTHVDGTGRLQTVRRETNPRFYRLIEAFRDLTGVPMVLNTSFNENEPVVCRPEEALECFLRTRMDLLVLGNWVVQRSPLDSCARTSPC